MALHFLTCSKLSKMTINFSPQVIKVLKKFLSPYQITLLYKNKIYTFFYPQYKKRMPSLTKEEKVKKFNNIGAKLDHEFNVYTTLKDYRNNLTKLSEIGLL